MYFISWVLISDLDFFPCSRVTGSFTASLFYHFMLSWLMDRHEHETSTLAYYNQQAQEHLRFRGEGVSQYWSQELAHFQELLPQGSVLEIGCGTGNEAILLRQLGYDYVGLDLSLGMLSIAKSVLPRLILFVRIFAFPALPVLLTVLWPLLRCCTWKKMNSFQL